MHSRPANGGYKRQEEPDVVINKDDIRFSEKFKDKVYCETYIQPLKSLFGYVDTAPGKSAPHGAYFLRKVQ
jgi:hypothetical protein